MDGCMSLFTVKANKLDCLYTTRTYYHDLEARKKLPYFSSFFSVRQHAVEYRYTLASSFGMRSRA